MRANDSNTIDVLVHSLYNYGQMEREFLKRSEITYKGRVNIGNTASLIEV